MKPLASNALVENRYLVVHLIGKGGMGEVYLAIDQRLGSPVALKRTAFFEDEMLGSAFEREAKILARLRHNALPKVSDHFVEDGNQYLVMEYIAGDDLARRMEISKKAFPLEWMMFWADRLLDALDYLHANEPPIIHRDIKPQNLKLTEDNQIILLDFGLSKNTLDASRVSTGAASARSVVGYTPQYAPIEQIRGTGTNARSDIFSLSSTLYQLLTNVVPPDALARAEAVLSEDKDPLVPASEVNPQVPRAISDILARGMQISQDKRFSTAREMQKVLRDAFAPEAQSRNTADIAAAPPVSQTSASDSLKTNVVSVPDREISISPREFQSQTSFAAAPALSENYVSAPRASTAFSSPGENRKNSLPLFLAGVAAILLAATAIIFGFRILGSSNVKPEQATEIKAAPPSDLPKAETPQPNSMPAPEAPSTDTGAEKTEQKSVESSAGGAKNIQPAAGKTNQKSPSDAKVVKPAAKPTAKAETKPTPLPRILP